MNRCVEIVRMIGSLRRRKVREIKVNRSDECALLMLILLIIVDDKSTNKIHADWACLDVPWYNVICRGTVLKVRRSSTV